MCRVPFRSAFLVVVACAIAAGCKKDPSPEAGGSAAAPTPPPPTAAAAPSDPAAAVAPSADPAAPSSAAAAAARSLFESTCAVCHGPSGHGDGPAAAALNPKPRNYSDKAWQASVSDEDLRTIIVKGGAMVGKSPTMPGQPQLADQPAVVDELVALIRAFGK